MGRVKVELSATINLGNFQSVKGTVGFEEEYIISTNDPTELEKARDDKFKMLLEVCEEKLDEAILKEVHRIQQLTSKKEKSVKIED